MFNKIQQILLKIVYFKFRFRKLTLHRKYLLEITEKQSFPQLSLSKPTFKKSFITVHIFSKLSPFT